MQKQRKTSNTTTSEIVLESLREQIINGILQPQEKLVEAEIARKIRTQPRSCARSTPTARCRRFSRLLS